MSQQIKKGTIIYYKGNLKDIGIVLECSNLYKIFWFKWTGAQDKKSTEPVKNIAVLFEDKVNDE